MQPASQTQHNPKNHPISSPHLNAPATFQSPSYTLHPTPPNLIPLTNSPPDYPKPFGALYTGISFTDMSAHSQAFPKTSANWFFFKRVNHRPPSTCDSNTSRLLIPISRLCDIEISTSNPDTSRVSSTRMPVKSNDSVCSAYLPQLHSRDSNNPRKLFPLHLQKHLNTSIPPSPPSPDSTRPSTAGFIPHPRPHP